jgi:hypothetical protein
MNRGLEKRLEALEQKIRPQDKWGPLVVTINPRRANGNGIFATKEEYLTWWAENGFTQPPNPIVVDMTDDNAQS